MSDIQDYIRVLLRLRPPAFHLEEAVRLHQPQNWIYRSQDSQFTLRVSGRIAAVALLNRIASRIRKTSDEVRGSAAESRKLLADCKYQSLYDGVFGAQGGWTKLIQSCSRRCFDEIVEDQRGTTAVPVEIALYRLRYLDHPHQRPQLGNLEHAKVFVWLSRNKKPSGSTIRNQWKSHKSASIPLLVSERFCPFHPTPSSDRKLGAALVKASQDLEYMKRFFGMWAYIEDRLVDDTFRLCPCKGELGRVRPETKSLSDAEMAFFANYSQLCLEFKDN